jgi:hypothetical protein
MPTRKGQPMSRACLLVSVFLWGSLAARGQVSGWASATYGFQSNPLSTAGALSDQVKQGEVEVEGLTQTGAGGLKVGYVGGLVLFNRYVARNYYEHRLSASYSVGPPPAEEQEATDAEDNGRNLDLGVKIGARHDKEDHREYDNIGLSASALLAWGKGSSGAIRLSNEVGLRRYLFLAELNNLWDVLHFQFPVAALARLHVEFLASAGVKHFTTAQIDTARYESVTSGSPGVGNKGKGKGSAASPGKDKGILVTSSTSSTFQVSGGVAVSRKWEDGLFDLTLLYRLNTKSGNRLLVQYANASLLSEDIYNDFFSADGPEAELALRQGLPLGFRFGLHLLSARRDYHAPAFDFEGNASGMERADLHVKFEASLSRLVTLSEAVTLEVSLSGGATRNQSNDAFNDYSLFETSVGVGFGF